MKILSRVPRCTGSWEILAQGGVQLGGVPVGEVLLGEVAIREVLVEGCAS